MTSALSRLAALSARHGAIAVALGALGLGAGLLAVFPRLEIEVFARGAAWGAGLFLGAAPERLAEGWLIEQPRLPIVVTAVCSATDFFLMVATVLVWRLARDGHPPAVALGHGLAAAVPVSMAVNALRIVAVATAHRWLIPLFPAHYGALLHMAVGAAVFLPALIALHLGLELHGRLRHLALRPLFR